MSVMLDESAIKSQVGDAGVILSLRDLRSSTVTSSRSPMLTFDVPKQSDHGAHRSIGVRQEHRAALHQPHE